MKKTIILTFIILVQSVFMILKSQPEWSVNPGGFGNSMSVTGAININYVESVNPNDIVGAFVGDECRGLASPVYVPAVDRFIVYLMVYSNLSVETITFKVYQQSTDQIFDIEKTMDFVNNGVVGTTAIPYIWSNPTLSDQAYILTYEALGEVVPAEFYGNNITIFMPYGADFSNIVSVFTTSPNAQVTVNGEVQISGVTANDFTSTVEYLVRSADETTTNNYFVNAEIGNSPPTDIFLSGDSLIEIVYPGTTVGIFSTEDINAETFVYSLVIGEGADDNSKFLIDHDTLKTNHIFNYEAQNVFSIRVRTTDEADNFFEKHFEIRVIEYYKDIFISENLLLETTPIDSLVAILTNTDTVNFANTYSLVEGFGDDDNRFFKISNDSLLVALPVDYEKQTQHQIRVKLTDNISWFFEKELIIYIIDENDEPPIAPDDLIYVDETVVDEVIYTVEATDADVSPEFRIISYYLDNSNLLNFSIDSVSGEIIVVNNLNFNVLPLHSLIVNMTDGVNWSNCTITVYVVPIIPDSIFIEVSDLTKIDDEIFNFNSIVRDESRVYSFTPDIDFDNNKFTLLGDGTLILDEYLDYDKKNTYEFGLNINDFLVDVDVRVFINVIYTDKTNFKANKLISPNNDNYLDLWQIENEHIYKDCLFQIFTVDGTIVFEQVGYFTYWDGTFKGKELPIGVYYYLVTTPRGEYIKGSITLIR
jgi:gliding motility-associated-like protein